MQSDQHLSRIDPHHYADDVIWAGDEDQGFATSHRAVNVGLPHRAVALGSADR